MKTKPKLKLISSENSWDYMLKGFSGREFDINSKVLSTLNGKVESRFLKGGLLSTRFFCEWAGKVYPGFVAFIRGNVKHVELTPVHDTVLASRLRFFHLLFKPQQFETPSYPKELDHASAFSHFILVPHKDRLALLVGVVQKILIKKLSKRTNTEELSDPHEMSQGADRQHAFFDLALQLSNDFEKDGTHIDVHVPDPESIPELFIHPETRTRVQLPYVLLQKHFESDHLTFGDHEVKTINLSRPKTNLANELLKKYV